MDEFDFMSKKVVRALLETAEVVDKMDEPFRSGGIAALEEFYFRVCGKHFDWEEVRRPILTPDQSREAFDRLAKAESILGVVLSKLRFTTDHLTDGQLDRARDVIAAALQAHGAAEREAVLEEAEMAFKAAYSKQDDPLIGVMYGLKAVRALSAPAAARGDSLCQQGDHFDVDGKCTACGRVAPAAKEPR